MLYILATFGIASSERVNRHPSRNDEVPIPLDCYFIPLLFDVHPADRFYFFTISHFNNQS